jgi:hypothetical protein
MNPNEWTWAALTPDELALVSEAERTLGATYVLAYQPAQQVAAPVEPYLQDVRAAALSDSQLECLRGLEQQLDAVLVAYQGQR